MTYTLWNETIYSARYWMTLLAEINFLCMFIFSRKGNILDQPLRKEMFLTISIHLNTSFRWHNTNPKRSLILALR
jgi:hypothetical protein